MTANNDALPELPRAEYGYGLGSGKSYYTASQMRDYARAAIRALSADRGEADSEVLRDLARNLRNRADAGAVHHSQEWCYGVRFAANEVEAMIASGADFPECSGNPSDCPENEGRGCCRRNDGTDWPPSPAESAEGLDFQTKVALLVGADECDQADILRHIEAWKSAAPSGVSDADSRARFEAWARPRWSHYPEAFDIIPGRPEPEYNHDGVQAAWAGWLAAQPRVADADVERLEAVRQAAIHAWERESGVLVMMNRQEACRVGMRAVIAAMQPQPGRVEGMDGARWRKLCALVDTHNPAYWYVHPGMGCDRIKGEAQLVAAIDAAPTASSQEPDHG